MSVLVQSINAKSFLDDSESSILLDVRSPGEYSKGHIPGAVNLPLFSDKERAEVGTLYKQKNRDTAYEKGLEIVGPKMAGFVRKVKSLTNGSDLTVHCWRGGQRSQSMAWLLSNAGFKVRVIEGGYKAFRTLMLKTFEKTQAQFLIIGGKTGIGKTELLHALSQAGEQVIDLEGMANHKGSAFGALGQATQPTTEQFANDLFTLFQKMDINRRIWLENESRTIGTVYLPDPFLDTMKSSILINVDIPMNLRVQRLVNEYATFPPESLIDAFERIERRLGGQNMKAAIQAINAGEFHEAAAIALRYYDKSYLHAVNRWPFKKIFEIQLEEDNPENGAKTIIELANEQQL
ncbi:MAG: tRNA 2-selenouridine(34) synthase MnmH [Bacteroidota bacterium]